MSCNKGLPRDLNEMLSDVRTDVNDIVLESYLLGLIANDSSDRNEFVRELAQARSASFLLDYSKALRFDFEHLEEALLASRGSPGQNSESNLVAVG